MFMDYILLAIIIIVALVIGEKKALKQNSKNLYKYHAKQYFMTKSENDFYRMLNKKNLVK